MKLLDLSELATSVQKRYQEYFKPEDCHLPDTFKKYFKKFNNNDVIEYFEYSLVVHASSSLKIFIPNQWIYIAYFFVDYYRMIKSYKEKVSTLISKEDMRACVNNENKARMLLSHYNNDDKEFLIKFLSDYTWWNGGKTLDRNDYYVSPILSLAGLVNASQSYIADICKNLAEAEIAYKILDENISSNNCSIYQSEVISKPLQLIYYGAPGTGKSFTIDRETNEDNSVRTTFHPDTDYASFVGAYKPTMELVDVAFTTSDGKVKFAKPDKSEDGRLHTGKERKIVYKYVPQAFMKAYVEAWKRYSPDEDVPYYLVIEEINRGNCAQIFGDLFQLLDRNNQGCSSYAISADEDIAQFLRDDDNGFAKLSEDQRQAIGNFILVKDSGKEEHIGHSIMNGSKLLLPPNLRIWATMNTSDQSLFPIDSAFKRRWNWKYMPIDYHPIDNRTGKPIDWKFQIGDALYSWGEFLGKINPEIYTLNESSDKQMGYFFAKADPSTGVISEEVFLNKVLFYLWTDVFKDYDVSSEIFRNEKKNRSFIFTDFFDKEQPTALANFVGNLKLTQLEIDIDSIKDEDSSDMEISVNNQGQRDFSRYSINGEGKYNKRQTVLQSLRLYIEINPTLTAADVISNWNKANPQIPFFILSSSEYETRIAEYPNQRDRFWSVTTGTCEKVYVTNQWNTNRIAEFMNMMNNSGFGIHIEKVAE